MRAIVQAARGSDSNRTDHFAGSALSPAQSSVYCRVVQSAIAKQTSLADRPRVLRYTTARVLRFILSQAFVRNDISLLSAVRRNTAGV